MAGINLSSSTLGKDAHKTGFFDGSFFVVTLIFFLVLAGFGGLRWYIKSLDTRIADLAAAIGEQSAALRGANVDRVAHFDDRLTLIGEQLKSDRVDSQKLLGQLESVTLPAVKLTNYEYDATGKSIVIEGETDSFRYVAQQILSFKSESLFAGITVQSLDRTETGRVKFAFTAELR